MIGILCSFPLEGPTNGPFCPIAGTHDCRVQVIVGIVDGDAIAAGATQCDRYPTPLVNASTWSIDVNHANNHLTNRRSEPSQSKFQSPIDIGMQLVANPHALARNS